MPIGKKLKYGEYAQINEVVKHVFSEHNLNRNNIVHYIDRKYCFWAIVQTQSIFSY